MNYSDDTILNPKIEFNGSLSDFGSAPRLPAFNPNDLFESNTAEIEEIKQALPPCDESGLQLDTTTQIARLFDDSDDFAQESENVSEPLSENQISAQERASFFKQKVTS